ncbi:unnamed protein product [Rhizophagus irregularis]|uniref:mRNA stability protein n=1 Tax=Rhizophagus irregularis TaxID=588596 RepID=A0A2N1NLB5_9GLOM|nr:hypothetical protein RhiirC2_738224 [Rhizophagus irregularis]CAB4401440.1 unnamed protein product [Rhizophagus irregularis]CAB5361752.1 unnamed protein product [Rhizophagus irregularis]
MNPARRNKIDLDKLTEEERKHFRMYGKLPAGKAGKDLISHKLKERKYFDSGDYALSKAGKTSGPVGVQHPSPETIPHSNAIAAVTHNSSPVKESSLVHETEIDEKADTQSADADNQTTSLSTSNQTTPVPVIPELTPASTLNSSTTSSTTTTNNS